MFKLVQFIDDKIYHVCKSKHVRRFKNQGIFALWTDRKMYQAKILVSSTEKKCLDGFSYNLNNNIPIVVMERCCKEIEENKNQINYEQDQSNHTEHNMETNKDEKNQINYEKQQSSNTEQSMETDVNGLDQNFLVCSYCSYVVVNLDIHLTVCENYNQIRENSDTLAINEEENQENQLCMYCGLLCIDLNEHIQSAHGVQADLLEINGNINCTDKKKARTYQGKQHYCMYCHTLHFKLSRHLEAKHRHEKNVQEAIKYKKGSIQRRTLFIEIQKKGDFIYNTKNPDSIINMRRHIGNNTNNIPCPYCEGYYSKKNIRNHVRLYCLAKTEEKKRDFEKKGLMNLITSGRSLIPTVDESANDSLKTRIFPNMKYDDISKAITSDKLAILYGNYLATKYGSSRHHDKMIKNKLRHLSRLFLEMKKKSDQITDVKSIFDSTNFDVFIKAVYALAGLKNGKYENPSVGPSSVTLILQVGAILETEAIKNKDHNLELETKRFCKLVKTQCSSLINKMALENRTQQQRAKVVILPKTNDIKELSEHLELEIQHCINSLKEGFSYSDWMKLNKTILIKIMTFNRKRPGDVEKSQIVEYRNLEMVNEDEMKHLKESDKYLGVKYGRYIARGKLNRPASVLISKNEMYGIELILSNRTNANVDKNNPYLFATPIGSTEQFFRAGKALTDFCSEKGLENKNLTATKMRKHLATVTSTFDKDEQVRVSDFMGHAFNIHQNIYRQRPASQDILGMTKILNFAGGSVEDPISDSSISSTGGASLPSDYQVTIEAQETSRHNTSQLIPTNDMCSLPEYITSCESNSSDEDFVYDISYKPNLSNVLEEDEDTNEEPRKREFNEDDKKLTSRTNIFKIHRITKKTRWTTPEKSAVKKTFKHYFTENSEDIPSLETCQEFAFGNANLESRSPSQIRAWIIQQKKRAKTSSSPGWATPLRKMCRQRFIDYYENGNYPPLIELQNFIEENPSSGLTVPKLRSHLQHDFKYVKQQYIRGRECILKTT